MSNYSFNDDIRPSEIRPIEFTNADRFRRNSTLLINQFKKMVSLDNNNNNNNEKNENVSWFDKLRLRTNEAPTRPPLQVFPKESELIDTTALNQFDELMIECDSYLAAITRNENLMNAPVVNTSVLNRVRNAFTKPKFEFIDPNKLQNLLDRIFESEDTLTSMVEEAMPTRLSLALQAQHLDIRLDSCIKFNAKALQLNAIAHQRENEECPYVPWALREQSKNNYKTEIKVDDSVEYRESLFNRKKILKQAKKEVMNYAALSVGYSEYQDVTLYKCTNAIIVLRNMISKLEDTKVVLDKYKNRESAAMNDLKKMGVDHSQCSSCDLTYKTSSDIIFKLAAMQFQISESTRRLKLLTPMKDKLQEQTDK